MGRRRPTLVISKKRPTDGRREDGRIFGNVRLIEMECAVHSATQPTTKAKERAG